MVAEQIRWLLIDESQGRTGLVVLIGEAEQRLAVREEIKAIIYAIRKSLLSSGNHLPFFVVFCLLPKGFVTLHRMEKVFQLTAAFTISNNAGQVRASLSRELSMQPVGLICQFRSRPDHLQLLARFFPPAARHHYTQQPERPLPGRLCCLVCDIFPTQVRWNGPSG